MSHTDALYRFEEISPPVQEAVLFIRKFQSMCKYKVNAAMGPL